VLVAELAREEFGVEHPVVAMQQPSKEFGSVRRAEPPFKKGGWGDLADEVGLLTRGRPGL